MPQKRAHVSRRRAPSGAATSHRGETLVEEIGEVRDAEEPVGGREPARVLALAGEAHGRAPLLRLEVAAADIDEGDEVVALVLVQAGDHVADLGFGRVAWRARQ